MDRSERERAAVAAAGLAQVPFTRATPADVAGCEGFTNSVSNRTPGLCHRCERYCHIGNSYIEPALQLNNGAPSCDNWRPLLSADQIAAVDETMNHAAHRAPAQGGEKALPLGAASAGCTDDQQHTGGVRS